jgi:hypothetical protein
VEVKRLQSAKRLEQRIREGFDALENSGCVGLLFLDVSQALRNAPSRLGSQMSGRVIGALWEQHLRRYVSENCPPNWLRRVRRGREIRSLIILDSFQIPQTWRSWTLHSCMVGICIDTENLRRERQFDRVFAVIETGTATASNPTD